MKKQCNSLLVENHDYRERKERFGCEAGFMLLVLTGTVVLQGGRGQQGVVVWQCLGVEHVEARDERGRRAVHSLLLCRLHALCGVQEG